jgi:N-acyl-D-aspartate/D-glutamate deacylase
MAADLVVIDSRLIGDPATYDFPCQLTQGVEFVIINGEITKGPSNVVKSDMGKLLLTASSD